MTSTSSNLATDVFPHQLAIPPHGTQVATSPASHLAIPLATCPVTSTPGNFATLPAAHPATSVPSHLSPTTPLSVTNASGSGPTDTLGGESFMSLLNSDDTFGWLDFGGSDSWNVPFASSSDPAAAGSQVVGMSMPNYSLVPPGTTSLRDLELGASTTSTTYPELNNFNFDQYGTFGMSSLNQSHNVFVPESFNFSNSQLAVSVLPAPPTAPSPPSVLPNLLSDTSVPPAQVLSNDFNFGNSQLAFMETFNFSDSQLSVPALLVPPMPSPPSVLPNQLSNTNVPPTQVISNAFSFGNSQLPIAVLPAPPTAPSPPSVSSNPLSDINVPSAPRIPPTQLGLINQPVSQSATTESTETTSLGRSKRKTGGFLVDAKLTKKGVPSAPAFSGEFD
ncbi:hypothetical protein L210DRAFT_977582 [Boletus edulis BED1]|uniref:Uncharacterized protein n=1 Tax=Boletus edulis BED1 TaxID=1328754 RepID=A0AAD4BWW5_BOLED|nr:hypothetical protein L210DRAFT_977582 [Boletus edulis BED1]